MRHRAPWALSLALLAGLGAVAVAQEAPPASPAKQNSGNWFTNMWPFGQPAQKKTSAAPPKTQPLVDSAALQRDREWAAYWRRSDVCQRLLEIAEAKQDADLVRRVEQLQDRIQETYLQRIALLPMGNSSPVDDQALANHLNPSGSASRLTGGTAAAVRQRCKPGYSQGGLTMKRLVLAAFLSGLLGIGCMENQLLSPDSPPAVKAPMRPVPPPVTPDQVTPANTLEITKRLEEELNYAAPPPKVQPTSPRPLPESPDTK